MRVTTYVEKSEKIFPNYVKIPSYLRLWTTCGMKLLLVYCSMESLECYAIFKSNRLIKWVDGDSLILHEKIYAVASRIASQISQTLIN